MGIDLTTLTVSKLRLVLTLSTGATSPPFMSRCSLALVHVDDPTKCAHLSLLFSAAKTQTSHAHGRKLGDLGDTLAVLLIVTIGLIGFCAFLGWYSRRRG